MGKRSGKQKKKIVICPVCHTKIAVKGTTKNSLGRMIVTCPVCGKKGVVYLSNTFEEIDFYPVNPPFAFVKIVKDTNTLEKCYRLLEPVLSKEEAKNLKILYESLIQEMDIELHEIDVDEAKTKLRRKIDEIVEEGGFHIREDSKMKITYYIERDVMGYGKIDGLMKDPNIEDISCDGPKIPIYLYHSKYGSLKTNIVFKDEEELSSFVIKLAQKCGKYISVAEPMLDGTLPDGSRIQATLGTEVTARGSTFTIRKFRSDPLTPPDLIEFGTMSPEMVPISGWQWSTV